MAAVDSPHAYPESPMDQDDIVYPCKGCGEILEEGKAFELAGNRWHIDCFRCNTCGTLLDSDANLLLLGDGSLICNNCTYSCNACGNKIEDLAILTGDQAFCSGCFRCRNCKRKIENLRYARTSQGIFCMSCHESLMARRRKKGRTAKPSTGSAGAGKALPSLPPGAAPESAFTPEGETPPPYPESRGTPQQPRSPRERSMAAHGGGSSIDHRHDPSSLPDDVGKHGPILPASTYHDARPADPSDDDDASERGFLPMAFDPTPIQPGQPPSISRKQIPRTQGSSPPAQKENLPPRDYFGASSKASTKAPTRDVLSRDALSPDERAGSGSSRDVSAERDSQIRRGQSRSSPHIYHQEKGRNGKTESVGTYTPANGSNTASPIVASQQDGAAAKSKGPPLVTDSKALSEQDGFRLQDVPRSAKERARTSPRQGTSSPNMLSPVDGAEKSREGRFGQPTSPVSVDSQNSGVNPFDDPKRRKASQSAETPIQPRQPDRGLPLRGDSLRAGALRLKPVPSDPSTPTASSAATITPSSVLLQTKSSPHTRDTSTSSVPSTSTEAQSSVSRDNGSARSDLPLSAIRSSFDIVPPPRAANRPSAPSKSVANDDFIAPRHAPPPPPMGHRVHESISTMHSNEERRSMDSPGLRSAGLPKYSLDGGLSMDDDMIRIMRGEQGQSNKDGGRSSPSVLRRVSNAVKHGRSFSDRAATTGGRSSRNDSTEMSSPALTPHITSPASAEGSDALRASLRRAQLHIAELETEKLGLQEKLDGSSEITAVNTELREKRSTMAFLDTQREMVVRELEIMTEHLTRAKDNNQPLDLASLKTSILKEFAESLQTLKNNMGAQIEELVHKRNELTDEIGNLIQMKDKGFQEYENLSSKNLQLVQHNNELLRNIQGMYQDNRAPNGMSVSTNGLGIYQSGNKIETPTAEVRNLNMLNTDPTMPNLLHDPDAEPATVLTAPQVINIRKGGKPNKFNWRRGGEKITGKVTKGIKGAFVGTQTPQGQPYAIGHPYSLATQATGGSEQSGMNGKGVEDGRSGNAYAFFGQKNGTKPGQLGQMTDDSNPTLVPAPDASTVLFGSELSARCEFEGRIIPSIVAHCIQEVEKRGLDTEGIYRKSGGAGQVKTVQQGFEAADQNYAISDPDLDIHAVTSALKQYFRKLPTPLIAYDVYDGLLEAGQLQDPEKQVAALRLALAELPEAHRECLAYLVRHLALVMSYESQNLMTSLNLAVVFAPTIMRPLSIEREMSDMQTQRVAVQALLEHHKTVFADD